MCQALQEACQSAELLHFTNPLDWRLPYDFPALGFKLTSSSCLTSDKKLIYLIMFILNSSAQVEGIALKRL